MSSGTQVVLMMVLGIPYRILTAWTLQMLWSTFIAPGFGVRHLSLLTCLGVVTLHALFFTPDSRNKTDEDRRYDFTQFVVKTPIFCAMSLLFGRLWLFWFG